MNDLSPLAAQHPSPAGYSPSKRALSICAILASAGLTGLVVSFIYAPLDGWLWLIIGFVTVGGIANAMLAWAAGLRVAQARWAGVSNRIGHAALAFAPLQAIALIALLIGIKEYAPWVGHDVHGKGAYLNVPFFVARNLVALGIFWALSFLMVRWSLTADAKAEISEEEHRRLNAISIAVLLVYVFTASIVSIDFIMALTPIWVSTMFPVFYFCTSLYAAMAAIIIVAATMRNHASARASLQPQQFHDMGNLMLALSLFDMGLFYAQYLTIWYENLPEETPFLLVRYMHGPWPWLGWTSLILAYAIPFIILQSRTLKRSAALLAPVAALAILGIALERYVLVVPSLAPHRMMIFSLGILFLLGFAAACIGCMLVFLGRYGLISTADDALKEANPGEIL